MLLEFVNLVDPAMDALDVSAVAQGQTLALQLDLDGVIEPAQNEAEAVFKAAPSRPSFGVSRLFRHSLASVLLRLACR